MTKNIRTLKKTFLTPLNVCMLYVVFSFILMEGCSEDPSPVGSALLPKNVVIKFDSLYANSSTTYRAAITGNSSRLLLGRYRYQNTLDTIEARTLVQFNLSSTRINPDSVVSASLRLVPAYWFKDSTGTLSFTIHKIISTWREDTITFAGSENLYASSESVYTFTNPRDQVFPLDTSLINMWLRNPPENYGVLLKPTAQSTVVYGFTIDLLNDIRPKLIIRYHAQDTVRVDSVGTIQEAFVANSPPRSADSSLFVVQAGIADRGFVKFDVGRIPRSASIASAVLEFVRDSALSVENEFSLDSIVVQLLVDNSTPPHGGISVLAQPTGGRGGSKFSADIKSIVQQWVTGKPNYGVALRAFGEFTTLDRFAFYGAGADSLNRPTLRIYYSILR